MAWCRRLSNGQGGWAGFVTRGHPGPGDLGSLLYNSPEWVGRQPLGLVGDLHLGCYEWEGDSGSRDHGQK